VIPAFATLAFLVAGWVALYAVVMTSDDLGAKIIAALKGRSIASQPIMVRPVSVRISQRYPALRSQPVRATAEWRAAA
jgi:hypothetical protein